MESWNRYLEELRGSEGKPVDSEKYFGQDPEEIPCMDKIRQATGTFEHKIGNCMRGTGYKFLGQGAFRTTFSIPGNDEMVLKITHIPYAKGMNATEADLAMGTKYNYIVPKVYDAADDYLWIKQQFVYDDSDDIAKVMEELFPEFGENALHDAGPAIFRLAKFAKTDFKILPPEEKSWMKNRALVTAAMMYAEFNLSPGDLRYRNYGYVLDKGKPRFVIHDISVSTKDG